MSVREKNTSANAVKKWPVGPQPLHPDLPQAGGCILQDR
jgi:hypothetical protein